MNRGGFTLIEVLIGLVILAFGLLGIAGMQASSVKGNYISNNVTEATYVAKDRLEFLKNLSFNNAQLNVGNYADGNTNASGIVFTRAYSVNQDGSGFKTITYNVTWNDGVRHHVSFTMIRSQ